MKEMGIQYFFGNITTETDTMIQKFSKTQGSEIKTFDIAVPSRYAYGGGLDDSGRAAASGGIYESVMSAVVESVSERVGE